ncbi:MAG: hypothetical protein GOMPHAMPRED_002814 [Gomphillus americanus]|uniref:PITH domain-containing protein n=1 Tax=Gomphillus americanus TaxID=1940652 RepID=A0A8H3FIC8_9LECA|nr:MAG: hypothetical protein GOMPHAMPRED_002814 [Gomphillus americanus]
MAGEKSFPTFKIFKNAQIVETIEGADKAKLSNAVKKIAAEADGDGAEGGYGKTSATSWLGAALAKGYRDVTDQVDVRGLDLMNSDSSGGSARDLFANGAPSALGSGKGSADKKDWVESDTDEQMMLFMPFQSTLKVHSLHVTSLAQEETMRPKTIRLYKNRAHTLGFDEADDIEATQTVELSPEDWDDKTGTARIELRFVKFQNITSLVLFVADGDGDAEKTRLDRIRLIGESGEKREMGKLEKIGDGTE